MIDAASVAEVDQLVCYVRDFAAGVLPIVDDLDDAAAFAVLRALLLTDPERCATVAAGLLIQQRHAR